MFAPSKLVGFSFFFFCMTRSVIFEIAVQSAVHSGFESFAEIITGITLAGARYILIKPVCWSVWERMTQCR